MPRIRQYAERDAMSDFVSELNAQRARFGYSTQRTFGPAIGVCQVTAGNYMRHQSRSACSDPSSRPSGQTPESC